MILLQEEKEGVILLEVEEDEVVIDFKVQTSSLLKFLVSTLRGVVSPLSSVSIRVVRDIPLQL